MSGPQIWLCLFTFRLIASKQLNGLTTIDIFSWLGGAVVTHPFWVQVVPGSIPGSGNGFYVWFLICCCCVFTFLSKKHIIYRKILQFLLQCNLFSILNVLRDLWPIIRVKRYRPSIFKPYWAVNSTKSCFAFKSLSCKRKCQKMVAFIVVCSTQGKKRLFAVHKLKMKLKMKQYGSAHARVIGRLPEMCSQ